MKVALYTSLKVDSESINALMKAFENHERVESVVILNPLELEITATQNGVSFEFNGVILNKANFDLVVIRGGFSDVVTTLEIIKYCLASDIKIFDNNLHLDRYMINKKADIIKFANAGIKIPRTKFYSNVNEVQSGELAFPVIIKTIGTGQGKNVSMAHNFDEVLGIVESLGDRLTKLIFQEFIDYEKDIRLFVLGDEVVGAMRRIPKDGEFRANFSLGGDVEIFDAPEEMKTLAIKAARACNLEMSGVDVLIDKNGGYWILEANRTPGLAGISQALGIDVAERLVEFILSTR
jgi:RimK family alpha-L-glutamate ligase